MINSIFGKIGGGKTLYTVAYEIIPELVEGYRTIVTNVALDLPALAQYLADTYPKLEPIDLHRRVRILTIEEMGEFFAHRENGVDLDIPSEEASKKGANVCYDFDPRFGPERDGKGNYIHLLGPVKYVLDEVHVRFDARGWQRQGPHVTFYNSQHRKLDDEIVFVSQFPELVDKRLKAFSQEYIYAENNALVTFWSIFRAPSYFTVKSYLRERTGVNDVAQWTKRFSINLKIAACYDTSAGVGIKGRKRPESRKKKGINLLWAIPAVALAGWGVNTAYNWGTAKLSSVTGPAAPVKSDATKQGSVTQAGLLQQKPIAAPPIADGGIPPQFPLTVSGTMSRSGRQIIVLSDGRVIGSETGLIKLVNANFVQMQDGTVLWVRSSRFGAMQVGRPVDEPEGRAAGTSAQADSSSKGGAVLDVSQLQPLPHKKPPTEQPEKTQGI